MDRRGSSDYKCYDIPVTDEFKKYIETETGFELSVGKGKSDIVTLCENVCGANLSIGYYSEHKAEEYLVLAEWYNTLSIVKRMLKKPLGRYPIGRIL